MNRFLLLVFFWGSVLSAKADQLAYLSESDAQKAAERILQFETVYLYCGCCDDDSPRVVQVENVRIRKTDYEEYYEVVLVYTENGLEKEEGVDLAYTWIRKKGKFKTIGSLLRLDHDPCKPFPGE